MNLVWSQEASDSLAAIYFYILKDSPQNAVMVIDKIIYERNSEDIIILDIFDGKQNPSKLDKY